MGSKADKRQVGGDHYKKGGEEHWSRQYRLFGPGYFVGCITKYVERYQYKNGYEDLLKAQHFLEKLIELEGMKPMRDDSKPTGYGYVNQDSLGPDKPHDRTREYMVFEEWLMGKSAELSTGHVLLLRECWDTAQRECPF